MPGQSLSLPMDKMRGYRPSSRYLSWRNESKGDVVNRDLAGEDRPESVTAILQDHFNWGRTVRSGLRHARDG